MSKKIAGKKNGRPEEWNGIKIFEYAKQGDEDCIRAIEEMTEVLGKGIASICYVLNPQMVVLGGEGNGTKRGSEAPYRKTDTKIFKADFTGKDRNCVCGTSRK